MSAADKIRTTKSHKQVPDDRAQRTHIDGHAKKGGFGKGGWGREGETGDDDEQLDPRDPMYEDELTVAPSKLDAAKAAMAATAKEFLSQSLQERLAALVHKMSEAHFYTDMPATVIRWTLDDHASRESLIEFLHALQRAGTLSAENIEAGLHQLYDSKAQKEASPAVAREEALSMVMLGIDRVIT